MRPSVRSALLSLVLPIVLVLTGVLVLGPRDWDVAGVPALFVFLFVMFPVTTGLMWLSWTLWDRHLDLEDEAPASAAGGEH